MAYAAVLSLVQTLKQILDSDNQHLLDKKKLLIQSLLEKAPNLQDFLEDSWQIRDEAVQCLEQRIRDVAYSGADIIDSLMSNPQEGLLQQIKFRLHDLISGFRPETMEQEYQDLQVIEEIDSILEEATKIEKDGVHDLYPRKSLPSSSSTHAVSVKNTMVGFDDDLMQLKGRLTTQKSELQTIPIVGMGGSGKTTLARNVYDDPFISNHFDTRAWITVSQEYNMRELLLCLLDCTTNLTDEMRKESNEKLAIRLHKSLKDRRYLVVTDDVWSIKAWDDVKMLFPDNNNGSRIMLTTRLSNIAGYVDSFSYHHHMHFFNDDESWKLLQKTVFLDEHGPSDLEEIGKAIAKNCKGLPLTIAVIGGLLSKHDRTKDFWVHVAENVSSVIASNDDQCLKVLSLSYNYLPHHLKPCFLYMGAFPEDYEIRVSKLIKLWAAEGFLKPITSKSLDEVAMEYLQDLIDRNLLLVRQQGTNGKTKSCSFHDLLRDLCVREGHKEKFLCVMKSTAKTSLDDTDGQRRLIVHGSYLTAYDRPLTHPAAINGSLDSVSVARSFIGIGRFVILPSLYLGLRLLRVLDVAEIEFRRFPEEVLELYNLSYLSFTCEEKLPSSIYVLKNLQTLNIRLRTLTHLFTLPVEIWKMPQLRHLCFTRCVLPIPPSVASFPESLETLSVVRDFKFTEESLKRIQNLKKLGINYEYITYSAQWSLYCLNNLEKLHKLEILKCEFGVPNSYGTYLGRFPPKLSFPPNLKKLTLCSSNLPWEDVTLIGSLPKLEILKLYRAFEGEVWEPIEGEFSHLKYLKLESMDVVHWDADDTHFPSLQRLILKNCHYLEEIPSGIGEIPTLQLIQLDDCSNELVTSANNLRQEQESLGNYSIAVRVNFAWYDYE